MLTVSGESPLNMLSAIATSPNPASEVEVKVVSLGIDSNGVPFELFLFPQGCYYSLEHLSKLLFSDIGTKLLSKLSPEQLSTSLIRDLQLKVVYISTAALKSIIKSNAVPPALEVLAKYSVSELLDGSQKLIAIEGLKVSGSVVESFMKAFISPYRLERRTSQSGTRSPLSRNASTSNRAAKRTASTSVESQEKKDKKKRLSIDTRFSETLESNSILVEQLKSSMALRQQQQAIIDSRTKSAHPDNSNSNPFPKVQRRRLSIDQELPKRSFDASESISNPYIQSSKPVNSQEPRGVPVPHPSKEQFLATCERLYDSNDDLQKMQNVLRDQIRKSSTLLYALQNSQQMIESLVKKHYVEYQGYYNEKFRAAFGDLNRRLGKLENDVFGIVEANTVVNIHSAIPRDDGTSLEAALHTIDEKTEH